MTAYMAPGYQTVEEIVASQWFTTVEEMHTKKKNRDVVDARNIVMWYAVVRRGYTFNAAGKIFNRDHVTAINGVRTVNNLIETDRNFRERFEATLRHIEKIGVKLNIV